ncbi:hypothetical protein [Clostridium massiliamazoniense]|uniref:hypothetical protein n=1 Tax=Clostridium massiliamazoniense TaxID=1347366 RepID=UPI0006D7BAD6|nr:hypothetical protein [Clostridium massiliamazoniense]
MMKLVKIFITLLILIFITAVFTLKIYHLKNYGLLIPTFLMYIFIPLLVVLNLIIKMVAK